MSIIAGVDIGGTFTDVFCVDDVEGRFFTAKVPSIRRNIAEALGIGLTTAVGNAGAVAAVVHGTTVGTNALLERRGAPVGMITTRGFRDVLELRRRDRPTTWRLWGDYEPIVPRNRVIEVDERTLADGTILCKVDIEQVKAAAESLRAVGAEAVCIVFVHSYVNDENEQAAVRAVRSVWPNAYVSASCEILREIREFERASTTAINSYLQPLVSRYLDAIHDDLGRRGCDGKVLIVQSNGGTMSTETASRFPVRTALSGPAAGVIAAASIAEAAGYPDVISCDMGGTSFDVALVTAGERHMSAQTTIDFGLVVRTPMIEILTISAGGGSIAWIDRAGLLQIGPESAGADPGPVCYGRGNVRPTVTDANLVLGRINSRRPIGGGGMGLDRDAAGEAIAREIGKPLGLGMLEAAEAIVRVANARMAGALRVVSVERGYDPRKFALMPFGGGGPLHACALIANVGIHAALVPRYPGLTSALGCVLSDLRHDSVHTLNRPLDNVDCGRITRDINVSAREALALLRNSGVPLVGTRVQVEVEASYAGQTHSVMVPLELSYSEQEGVSGLTESLLRNAFKGSYAKTFRTTLEFPIMLLALRTTVIGERPSLDLSCLQQPVTGPLSQALLEERPVWFDGRHHATRIYDRDLIPVGAAIAGPAIIEQADTTLLIDPAMTGVLDGFGNVIIKGAA